MSEEQVLHEGQILKGALFDEPMRVETATVIRPMMMREGDSPNERETP